MDYWNNMNILFVNELEWKIWESLQVIPSTTWDLNAVYQDLTWLAAEASGSWLDLTLDVLGWLVGDFDLSKTDLVPSLVKTPNFKFEFKPKKFTEFFNKNILYFILSQTIIEFLVS